MRTGTPRDQTSLHAVFGLLLLAAITIGARQSTASESLDREGTQWSPFLEWTLANPTREGNPYDLIATATFVHEASGEKRTTGMYYAGDDQWRFRFTGTQPGQWKFETKSDDPDLNGKRGTATIRPNPGSPGFVAGRGNKWVRTGTSKAFVPQLVMYDYPRGYFRKPEKIDTDIKTFLIEHGYNGFHTAVLCAWFDFDADSARQIKARDPNPDARTFEALELLITKTYAAGGTVHIWAWGDEQRKMTPARWGINGTVDKRLQRYIAARLGPLPGWTMGYGFDLWEWVKGDQLTEWHDYLRNHFGWPHLLGGRASQNQLNQLSERLDYSGYEQHRPDYAKYVETIEKRPGKPSFSEDRFRIRKPSPYPKKDYTEELTRRGLWHSTMAGGVANIWGNLVGAGSGRQSMPYPHPEWIKTYSKFFRGRFLVDMIRDNDLTDGVCLRTPDHTRYLFYKEDTDSIRMVLGHMTKPRRAIAVDTKRPYNEIVIHPAPKDEMFRARYKSDWAVAVGDFDR